MGIFNLKLQLVILCLQGQGFFDGETNAADTDDMAGDSIGILGVHDTKVFKRIKTVPVICLLMFLVVSEYQNSGPQYLFRICIIFPMAF